MPATTDSLAGRMSELTPAERAKILEGLSDEEAIALYYDWGFWARPKQLPPPGDWDTWLLRAGRGFGKTRTGAGWVHQRALEQPGRWVALVARTPADARDYMIEGPGGILRNTHPDESPHYEPSKRRLTWPNGSWATIYSDDEPDQLRGFSGDTAWVDEFAKFKNPQETWDNLQFGMREASADHPRRLITTTPRPLKILKVIEADPGTVVVTGSSHENRDNLDQRWFDKILRPYEGTRLGRQEIHGEIIDDVEGALWTWSMIDDHRVRTFPDLIRVVVAVDPAVTSKKDSDETGIIVAGKGVDGRAYVLADRSCKLSPAGWGTRTVIAYDDFVSDLVVGEVNNGGDLVESNIRAIRRSIAYKSVRASRGKAKRAEPVANLYEQGLVSHVGAFEKLEEQQTTWQPEGSDFSPDRLDALVWALTELMLDSNDATADELLSVG